MASPALKKEAAFFFLAFFILSSSVAWADVTVSVGANCQSFTMINTTPLSWKIGGIRFFDRHTFWSGANDGEGAGWTMFHATVGGRVQQDLYFKSIGQGTDAPSGAKLLSGATAVFNRGPWNTETDTAYPDMYVLLRTGAPGIPDDPDDAKPLTLTQLDSVINVKDFYSPAYRYSYTDSLGVNGGRYSGGFIDTWYNRNAGKAETQIHIPIPATGFGVNGTTVNFLATGMNQYWMSLAIGQEYFHADLQWMAAMGAKETGIGTNFPVQPTSQNGVYGFWQIENSTGMDRALSYPGLFPRYSVQLSRARDVATSGINMDVFMTYYTRGNRGLTPVNSALMLNACFMSILVQYVNYYVCACATDICWMNALASAVDPYMGVAFMTVMYNVGQFSQIGNVVRLLNPNAYQATCANPNARTLMGNGNMNYVPDILNVVQNEVNASRAFERNNANLTLVDFQITESGLMDMFFGDGGTVATQGNGGLLLHYYDPAAGNVTAVRQQIWNTLDAAFNRLKGHTPYNTATTISFRYDFLAVLRTVKDRFPFLRQKQPNAGDATLLIPQNSGHYSSCSGGAADETYPYPAVTATMNAAGDMTVLTTVNDETLVRGVKWTLDYNWLIWNDATPVDTSSRIRRTYTFTALKADINAFRAIGDNQSGRNVWIMASDASGNSVFTKLAVTDILYPALDSAIMQDVNGDGLGEKITAFLTRSGAAGADLISQFSNFRYAWPLQTPLVLVAPGWITTVGNTLVYRNLTAAPGAGLGRVAVNYPSKADDLSASLLDRVGPALSSAILRTGPNTSAPDTLVVTITEPIRNINAARTAYLNFKTAGTTTKTPVASNSVVRQGTTATSWMFIFPRDTLAAYDSVNFVTTPVLISDTVGNPPLDINKMVKIQKAGNRFPSLDSAIIQDINGDGRGDRIIAYLTRSTADSSNPIDSFSNFRYSWPTQLSQVAVANNAITIAGSTLMYPGLVNAPGAGLGTILVNYPSKFDIPASLLDRIGPALSSAISRTNASAPDTLVVTVTEPIRNLTVADTAYLNLKKGGTKTAVRSTSVTRQGTTATSWVFIFPNNTLAAWDSVNFVHTTGMIFDTVGNPPLAINRMVRIQKPGARYPSLDSAFVQDANGDGLGDKITVYATRSIADSADSINSLRRFQYSWPTQTTLVTAPGNGIAVSGGTLVYATLPPTAGAGLGTVVLDYPSDSGLSVDLSDRVGPALTSAVLKATRNSTIPETLVVAVTEPIRNLTVGDTAYLNFKRAGNPAKTQVASVSVINTGTSTSWVFIFSPAAIASYDSVNFIHTTGLVFDAVGNPPLDINKMVVIQKQVYVVKLAGLELVPDTGAISAGDSIGFTARVVDDTGGVRPEFNALITWPALKPGGTRSTLRTASGGANTFYGIDAFKTYVVKATFTDTASPARIFSDSALVYVRPGKDFRIVIEADTVASLNSADALSQVSLDQFTNADTVYAIVRDAFGNFCRLAANAQWSSVDAGIASANAAAPRQAAGIIRRVSDGTTDVIALETGLLPDTVSIVIAPAVLTALRLVNAATGDTIRSITMKNDQTMIIKVIGTMSNAPGLWIEKTGAWSMNPQSIVLSVPLPTTPVDSWTLSPTSAGQSNLTVSSGTLSVTVAVKVTAVIKVVAHFACDNPFTPGVSVIPQSKRSANDPPLGTRIEVHLSTLPVDFSGNVLLEGNLTIFDAVGNCVADRKEMRPDGAMLYTIWDGKNRRGAYVAAGSYLGKIELVNKTDNSSMKLKTILGVR